MQSESLALALRREHQEIDAGIDACTAADPDSGELSRAIGALRRHIYLEEEFLFPLLRQAEPGLTAPILVMLREHAEIWPLLDELDRCSSPPANCRPAGSACGRGPSLDRACRAEPLPRQRLRPGSIREAPATDPQVPGG